MLKRLCKAALTAGLVAVNATVGISQTAPGTLGNPFKGGATLLHFSRASAGASLSGGRVVYYQCGAMETQLVLKRTISGALSATQCDELPDLKAGVTGQWNQWIRVTPGANGAKYQGLHAATISVVDGSTGGLVATLDCRGSNGVGTHHAPLTEAAEQCAQPLHFEGSFSGQIVGGAYKGGYLQGTYAGDLTMDPVQGEQGQPVNIVFEGVVLKPCAQKFTTGAAPGLGSALNSLGLKPAR